MKIFYQMSSRKSKWVRCSFFANLRVQFYLTYQPFSPLLKVLPSQALMKLPQVKIPGDPKRIAGES